jgi:hypothetical protein
MMEDEMNDIIEATLFCWGPILIAACVWSFFVGFQALLDAWYKDA